MHDKPRGVPRITTGYDLSGAWRVPCSGSDRFTTTPTVKGYRVNEKQQSEEYYAELAEHRVQSDANESNAAGTIYPQGEPIERTGRYADGEESDPTL
jgi:hypothetical protein